MKIQCSHVFRQVLFFQLRTKFDDLFVVNLLSRNFFFQFLSNIFKVCFWAFSVDIHKIYDNWILGTPSSFVWTLFWYFSVIFHVLTPIHSSSIYWYGFLCFGNCACQKNTNLLNFLDEFMKSKAKSLGKAMYPRLLHTFFQISNLNIWLIGTPKYA